MCVVCGKPASDHASALAAREGLNVVHGRCLLRANHQVVGAVLDGMCDPWDPGERP
jgi:hypothetical protein